MEMRIYIRTFGCPLNKFEAIVMEHHLREGGYSIVDSLNDSDIIIVNTCGVKKQTEDRIIDYLKHLNRRYPDKKLVLSGCLPLINRERLTREIRFEALTGPSVGPGIVDLVSSVIGASSKNGSGNGGRIPRDLHIRDTPITMPIGVSSGCLDKCSFCGTWFARGVVKSIPLEDLECLIRNVVKKSVREIHLTSSDLGAYGYDLRPRRNMVDLLKMVASIEGNFIVRIGMANPRWVYKWLDELIELFISTDRFYYFLHIPVQTGSERLLKIMNRSHGVEEYIESVKRLRREVDRRFSISTDVIVGHPGEEERDFELTLDLLKESEPDFVNISKFFPRPNTPAKYMDKVPTEVIKRRSIEVSNFVDSILIRRNRMWLGWRGPVLVNERGKNGTFMARNYAYKIIVVNNANIGDVKLVEVVDARTTWLKARIASDISSASSVAVFSLHVS